MAVIAITWSRIWFCQTRKCPSLENVLMMFSSTPEDLQACLQGQIENTPAEVRTELRDAIQGVVAMRNEPEARLTVLETTHMPTETTSYMRENVTAKRETHSLPVFAEKWLLLLGLVLRRLHGHRTGVRGGESHHGMGRLRRHAGRGHRKNLFKEPLFGNGCRSTQWRSLGIESWLLTRVTNRPNCCQHGKGRLASCKHFLFPLSAMIRR